MTKIEFENKLKEKVYYFQEIGSMELNSRTDNEITLGGMQLQELYLEIENGDNRPIKVTNATGSFLNRYAVADLKAKLIPANTKKLSITKITSLSGPDTNETALGLFEDRYVIWSVIEFVGLVLGFISLKMIKELGSKDRQPQ